MNLIKIVMNIISYAEMLVGQLPTLPYRFRRPCIIEMCQLIMLSHNLLQLLFLFIHITLVSLSNPHIDHDIDPARRVE